MVDGFTTLEAAAAAVKTAFIEVYEQRFKGDPAVNPLMEVDVVPAGVIDTAAGPQFAVVLVTPWTLNGLLVPGLGLPEQLEVAGTMRPVSCIELEGLGTYAQVPLVPHVTAYPGAEHALKIAESMVPVVVAAFSAV